MVPLFEDGTTVLVRQWRPSWWESSWEVPAGTVEDGEDPVDCARRELAEEAGLAAADWLPLGTARGTAVTTVVFHLFLARGLTETAVARDELEQDLVARRLPLDEALEAARRGEIQHSVSVAALLRAQAALR
jgi:ADP-ribose pyrophosphatase